MDALKRMTSPSTRVVRAGITIVVPAAELVPGDLVRLDAGDVVTADMRLVEARSLRINEAALTGESEPAVSFWPGPARLMVRCRRRERRHRRAEIDPHSTPSGQSMCRR